jgi:exonuclease III
VPSRREAKPVAPETTAEISWEGVTLLTVNTNGIKKNGHLLVEHLLIKNSLSCVQETKIRDSHQMAKINFNHAARFNHRLFVSDLNATSTATTGRRSGGVMTVLRSDFPGFDTAQELSDFTYPGRYLLVRVTVNSAPVYIHNVYSPVDDTEKAEFFDALPFSEFEDSATHLVLGDLNTPLDPRLDSSEPRLVNTRGRSACQRWLGCLGVIDPWRIHHPDDRVFTGPQPRKNRLDYILLSRDFSNALYGDAKYFQPKPSTRSPPTSLASASSSSSTTSFREARCSSLNASRRSVFCTRKDRAQNPATTARSR